jgi:hypothetical protein
MLTAPRANILPMNHSTTAIANHLLFSLLLISVFYSIILELQIKKIHEKRFSFGMIFAWGFFCFPPIGGWGGPKGGGGPKTISHPYIIGQFNSQFPHQIKKARAKMTLASFNNESIFL